MWPADDLIGMCRRSLGSIAIALCLDQEQSGGFTYTHARIGIEYHDLALSRLVRSSRLIMRQRGGFVQIVHSSVGGLPE